MRLGFTAKFATTIAITLMAAFAQAADFDMNPAVQAKLDQEKAVIAGWAADPVVVNAVLEQNRKGPIPEMDNAKWKATRRTDPTVKGFQANPAGQFLKVKLEESGGTFSESFLNAAQGEKVAFVEKTTSYIHKGQAKFDVPFTSGHSWQGKPEFDESTQTYAIQIAVAVFAEGKPVGALVVGVNLSSLEKVAKP